MKTFVRARKGADRERHFLPPDGQQGCTSRLRGKGRYEIRLTMADEKAFNILVIYFSPSRRA
ncbi:MAG: hypothetical protein AUI12_11620 [Acidobacteria bacterium 13_2_20CM_2_57_6]|nr:MAG: hypothetical protein AUI12_11620 [Acidobacteria bacterium 13_2_20CM_2_57_6]